jgi:hypothetical protein
VSGDAASAGRAHALARGFVTSRMGLIALSRFDCAPQRCACALSTCECTLNLGGLRPAVGHAAIIPELGERPHA